MLPWASQATTTIFSPASWAEAGLVPCAEAGIRQMLRCVWPWASRYSRMASRPAYSPCAPELGWNETPAKPVMSASQPPSWASMSV